MRQVGAGPAVAGEQGREPARSTTPPASTSAAASSRPATARRPAQLLAPRIDGDFTGTTSEILRWAACKWGINQNVVFAQAAVESWWQQSTLGDWGTDASACPPGHGLGADGKPGQCPQSYGILQNRYPYEQASWPGIGRLHRDERGHRVRDLAVLLRRVRDLAEQRAARQPVPQGRRLGLRRPLVRRALAHRPGRSSTSAKVRQYLSERIWLTPDFQQPG